jgi:hypothetical protein
MGKKATIQAEVHSDYRRHQVSFDALKWFEQAAEAQIVELARCGWGGDYPADEVAKFFEDENEAIDKLLDHCRDSDESGFECQVDESDARVWLKEHRPQVLESLDVNQAKKQTRTVQYYRCWSDKTWDTDFIEIPADTPDTHLDKAVREAAMTIPWKEELPEMVGYYDAEDEL